MKTKTLTFGIAMVALAMVQPTYSQENPTQKIKKESNKVINRKIDDGFNKLFGKKKKEEEQQQGQRPTKLNLN